MKQLGFKRGFVEDYPGLRHFTWRLDFGGGLNFEFLHDVAFVVMKIYFLIKFNLNNRAWEN